jgi:hypothetical protein
MLDLPDVTLIAVETQEHELARITLNDSVSKVNFGEVIVYSDQPKKIEVPGARYIEVPNWPDKFQQGEFYYSVAAQEAKTSHVLMIEWDAGIRDVSAWRDEFLSYDYIGAPWVWAKTNIREHSVGNGGFALMSKKLADAVYAKLPAWHIATDMHLSRDHRTDFERLIGAKWAPEEVGFQFAYEHGYEPRQASATTFGYHDIFNWPLTMDESEVLRRVRLVMASDYIPYKTPKLSLLAREYPWVRDAIGTVAYLDAEKKYRRQRPVYAAGQPGHHIGLPHHHIGLPHHRIPPVSPSAPRPGSPRHLALAKVQRDIDLQKKGLKA